MNKFKLTAVALAAAIAFSSTNAHAFYCPPKVVTYSGSSSSSVPYFIFGCAGGIILAALAANARDHRELTAQEAWSCGVLFWFSQPKGKKKP